jgi:hypothetical protein
MIKNQWYALYLLILLAIIIPFFTFFLDKTSAARADTDLLASRDITSALENMGCTMEEIRIDGWVKGKDKGRMTLADLKEMMLEIQPAVCNMEKADIKCSESQDIRQAVLAFQDRGMKGNISLYNICVSNKRKEYETYIILHMILDSAAFSEEKPVHNRMEEMLGCFGDDPVVSTTYTAAIPGKISLNEMEDTGRRLFADLDGIISEGSRDGEWVSLTGFSSRLGGGLDSGSGRLNLNIALRYNSYEGKTIIRLGTPVIPIPY